VSHKTSRRKKDSGFYSGCSGWVLAAGKEAGRRKKQEGRSKKEEGRRQNLQTASFLEL
jgi:hypothetical protein